MQSISIEYHEADIGLQLAYRMRRCVHSESHTSETVWPLPH